MIWLLAPQLTVDWGINGDGFFRLLEGETPSYSKQGHFVVAESGLLRSTMGPALDPPVRVPKDATALTIGADGTIYALVSGGRRELGCLCLARFPQGRQAPIVGQPGSDGFGIVSELSGGKLHVAISPTVEVAGPEILLGDIAKLDGDRALAERARKLSAGSSPLAGSTRTLTRSSVIMKLRGAQIDAGKFDLDMPDTVTVTRPAQEVPPESIVEAATAALESPSEVEPVPSVKAVRVPTGEYELKPGQPAKSGLGWSVPVAIVVGGSPAATVTVRFTPRRDAPNQAAAVKPGDQVTVRIESGALVVETEGVVRDKGAAGSQVTVYIPSTHKTIHAEVVNSTTVKVAP